MKGDGENGIMTDMFREIEKDSGHPKANPIFVVGIFRSGTSLLYALLNQHPRIALMFECNVLDFPEAFSRRRFKRNWLERQEFYNAALSRHRLTFANRLSGLEHVRTPEDLYRTYSDGKQAAYFGEKSPAYCLRLRQLARRCPGASFILLWRDPEEIYRSIQDAGRKVGFFRRLGMNRFIFYQEQMIRQGAELEFAGLKIHHVSYNDLVDKPGEICRGICQFLGIEFDPAMLQLAGADLSAIHHGDYRQLMHGQLMRGVIERRKSSEDGLAPEVAQKLQRFHARWHRLVGKRLPPPVSATEPALHERLYHGMAGRILFLADNARRALLEFLPLVWLANYRRAKNWFLSGRTVHSDSFAQEFSRHRVTILTSCLVLAAVAAFDLLIPPQMVFIPFYVVPSALLAFIVNRRWGTLGAVASAVVWTGVKMLQQPELDSHFGMLLWNCAMRFILLQGVVVVLDRIRLEVAAAERE